MKFELPTLYSRNENGSIQEWKIEVDDNKFRTVVGRRSGAIITSEWTTCFGKNKGQANETTDDEQAQAESIAKWKKKIKREGYWEDIKYIDNKNGFIEPMLAQKLRDHPEKVIFPCMVDKKYNGGRVIASSDGLFSRKGEQYASIPHILEALAPLFEEYPDLVLDGEGYEHNLRFKLNELMSILRTTKSKKITPELLNRSEQIVRFYVYDGYGFDDITANTGNLKRRDALKELLKNVPYVVWVPYRIANSLDEVYKVYENDVSDGYEGSIIRNINAPYEHKRSYNLLKVKPTDDSEGTVLDIIEGIGNASGLAATATIRWNNKEFGATFKGSQEIRRDILKNKEDWIGRQLTFCYNGLTGLNTPNYANIDPNNCFQGKK